MSEQTLDEVIDQVAREPSHVAVDGQSVQQRPLSEVIQAADRAAARTAAGRDHMGLIFRQLEPGASG